MTVEEFERMPDDGWRLELVRGQIVREPPAGFRHGSVAGRLIRIIGEFVEQHDLGEVVAADTGFVLIEEPPTVRAPDVAFVSAERIPVEGPPEGFARFAPDLAVEIVSPSNTLFEVQEKVLEYLETGTRAVWVVDPKSRTVMVYLSDDHIRLFRESDSLDGGEVLPGFRLEVARLFR